MNPPRDKHALREQSARYNIVSGAKNSGLSLDNRLFRCVLQVASTSYSVPTRLGPVRVSDVVMPGRVDPDQVVFTFPPISID